MARNFVKIAKDKNFLVLTTENDKIYKIDLNTGNCYGLNEKPIKEICLTNKQKWDLFNSNNTLNFSKTYREIFNDYEVPFSIRCELADTFASLGYNNLRLYCGITDYTYFKDNKKKILKYLKENYTYNEYFSVERLISQYQEKIMIESIRNEITYEYEYGQMGRIAEIFNIITSKVRRKMFLKWVNLGLIDLLGSITTKEFVQKWEDVNSEKIYDDFLTCYAETLKLYKLKEDEIKNSKIKNVQLLDYKNFSTEMYTVEVPQSVEDFIALGNEFHNCLGTIELNSYIIPNRRGVLVIRSINDDWKIACDFDCGTRRIEQFLLPYNRRPQGMEHIRGEIQRKLYNFGRD